MGCCLATDCECHQWGKPKNGSVRCANCDASKPQTQMQHNRAEAVERVRCAKKPAEQRTVCAGNAYGFHTWVSGIVGNLGLLTCDTCNATKPIPREVSKPVPNCVNGNHDLEQYDWVGHPEKTGGWRCVHCDYVVNVPVQRLLERAAADVPTTAPDFDKCPLGDQHVWTPAIDDDWVCNKCGAVSVQVTSDDDGFTVTTRDPATNTPRRAAPLPPTYRSLIEVPDGYVLLREECAQPRVVLTVHLGDELWLRKKAFDAFEWEDILFWDRKGQDAANRAKVQLRVNDIVKDWRERFGAP